MYVFEELSMDLPINTCIFPNCLYFNLKYLTKYLVFKKDKFLYIIHHIFIYKSVLIMYIHFKDSLWTFYIFSKNKAES